MSAIRNVGELASPYFLLELWVRREEIDIDPETYATLKRKARALVRDFRTFESRGEVPDDAWRERRRDLLGLVEAGSLAESTAAYGDLSVHIWRDGKGEDSALVGDIATFRNPDTRSADDVDPPATSFELSMDSYKGDADWGLLLSGCEVRVYRRSSGISQQYLALDFDTLVEIDDEANWRAFAGIFRAPAFSPGDDGVPLIRRVVDESRRHASALADDMRADVVDAAEAIIQGALQANSELIGEPNRATLHRLFEEALYYLYRLLFILYAEARDVLPVSGAGPYATTYSLDHLVELAREEPNRSGRYFQATLGRLFRLLWEGPTEAAEALGFEPVGGELFDPACAQLLDQCTIDDRHWRRALLSVALGAADSPRRRLGRRSSFAELGVDQLGSIYEGLLVLEPYLAPGPRALVRINGDRRVVGREDAEGLAVERELDVGDFVLESASGRRKGSGSFYTPVEITEYLAKTTIKPLVDPILATAKEDPAKAAREILELKVCDPAMGSGAFLIQAGRVLAVALARARAAGTDGRVTPEMVHRAKRAVVRRCLYGVDLNPLAVELAKVSLWLETLEVGRPLSFLDAHLRCGDSLVGVEYRGSGGQIRASQLAEWPKDAVQGLKTYLKKEAGEAGEAVLERLKDRKARRAREAAGQMTLPGVATTEVEAALEAIAAERNALVEIPADLDTLQLELVIAERFEELETAQDSLRNRLRAAANFWCAQWFWTGEDARSGAGELVMPPGQNDYQKITGAMLAGDLVPPGLQAVAEVAQSIAGQRHFFHWALEFPEVMLGRGGFDAVLGNPPWNTLGPSDDEFFRTYDPHTFKKGVAKKKKLVRKQSLRKTVDIDGAWRREARWLHELSHYAKPASGHYEWYAQDGQLRKGDANVFRQFVERAYLLLRPGGHLGQVLPDSFYVSSPATGLRQHLLTDGALERCYVFENRRHIFPIDSRIKVVLMTAQRGAGPTDRFKTAFFAGKNAAGADRSVGLEELPSVLTELEHDAPEMSLEQVQMLSPVTWAFPELQSPLDAEVAVHCAVTLPPLNLNEKGWQLRYCRELDKTNDSWRFREVEDLEREGAERKGLMWVGRGGAEWWPVVSGSLFYHFAFPSVDAEPRYWVRGSEIRDIAARQNVDGSSVTDFYRMAWRLVARTTDERTVISCLLPPKCAADNSAHTVWGGSVPPVQMVKLSALFSSFLFDFLIRLKGATNLNYGILNPTPAPQAHALDSLVDPALEVLCSNQGFEDLWSLFRSGAPQAAMDHWAIGQKRAEMDAIVAVAYGVSLLQYAAVLSTFPNLDTIQPMLPGEPKCFLTRDLALLAYCELAEEEVPDVSKLLSSIGVDLPQPAEEFRKIDARVAAYRELGAVPYRPTPRGGRPPTDPSLIEAVIGSLGSEAQTAPDIAEVLREEPDTIAKVLRGLVKAGEVYAEGRGKSRRYYVIED